MKERLQNHRKKKASNKSWEKLGIGGVLCILLSLFSGGSIFAVAESSSIEGNPFFPLIEAQYSEDRKEESPTYITLQECLRIAKEKSVEMETAAINLKIGALKLANAKAGYRPQVAVGVDYAIDNEKGVEFGSDRFEVFLLLTQSIFNSSENSSRLKEAATGLLSTELNLEKLRQRLLFSIADGYFALLAAQKQLEAELATVEKSARSYKEACTKYEDGLAAAIEVLQAETAFSSDKLKLQTQKNDLDDAAMRLSIAIGLPVDTKLRAVDADAPHFFDIELETCNKIALENNIELKINEKALEQMKAFYKRVKRARWPSLSLSAFIGENPDTPYDPDADVGLMLTLKETLYDGGIIRRKIKQAALEIQRQEVVIRMLKKNLLRDVKHHYYSLKNRIEAFSKAEKQRDLTRKLSKMVYRSYQMGVISLKEHLDTNDDANQGEIAYTTALAKYFIAEYRLKLKMGLHPIDTVTLPRDNVEPMTKTDVPGKATMNKGRKND